MTECGKFRERIVWERETVQSPAGSQHPEHWEPLFETPASCQIEQIGGGESFLGRQLEGDADYLVRQHYSRLIQLEPADRGIVQSGVYKGATLNIEWVKVIAPGIQGDLPELEIYCSEVR